MNWFTASVQHGVDYLDKKNCRYKQHLLQRTQLQTWLAKKTKNLTLEQLQDNTIRDNTSWRLFSSGQLIVLAVSREKKAYVNGN